MNLLILAILGIGFASVIGIAYLRRRPVTMEPPMLDPYQDDFPPKPKWKPTIPVDIERIIRTFASYIDHRRSFAVFAHGTCVLLPDESENAEADALVILGAIYHFHPDFDPRSMEDGNVLVAYSQPAFSVVFADEFATHRDYIEENYLDGITPEEALLTMKEQPAKLDERRKIGLFGRARMFLDAQEPKVIRIWKPE
jgi:hypothetical protein